MEASVLRPSRVLVVLGAAPPAAVLAGLADGAMAGASLAHVTGLLLVAAFAWSLLQAAVAAALPEQPTLRGRMAALTSWFSGEAGAARLLAAATAALLFVGGAYALAHGLLSGHRHPWLIAASFTAGLGVLGFAVAVLLLPIGTVWRSTLKLVGDPSPAAALLVLAVLVGGACAAVCLAGPPSKGPDLRALVILVVFTVTQLAVGRALASRGRLLAFALVVCGVLGLFMQVPRTALAGPDDLRSVETRGALSASILSALRYVTDGDGDGHSTLFSGGDCDDADPTSYPGASDPPRDGLDRDCNGFD